LADAQTQIGTALLPAMVKLANLIKVYIVPLIAGAADAIADFIENIDKVGDAVGDVQKTVEDVTGRDIGNDFANFTRIIATGGTALAIDALDDVQRGLQRASEGADIFTEKIGSTTQQLAQIHPALFRTAEAVDAAAAELALGEPIDLGLVPGIEAEMAGAVKAVKQGFGNLREALSNPPQFISREERISNVEAKRRRLNKQLNRAVEQDDPFNIPYYQRAVASADTRLARLRRSSSGTSGEIKGSFVKMGKGVERAWQGTEDKARSATGDAKRTAIRDASQAASRVTSIFESMDLFAAGANLIATWNNGMRSMLPTVRETAAAIGRAAGATMPVPAIVGAGGGGSSVTVHGNVYGGKAGLRQLQGDIDDAVRPTRRTRR
jgi:hypothetical protein